MIKTINADKCTGCGTCVEICPVDTFRLDKDSGKALIAYPEDCITCFICEMNCPGEAIYVHPYKEALPLTLGEEGDK